MPVAVKGSGGGSVTLTAGAAAADTTLTLPNTTGTVALTDGSGNQTVTGNLTVNGTSTLTGNVTSGGTVAMGSSFKRNRIINGNMQTWQRATSASGTYSSIYTYATADRWCFYSAQSMTTSQSTSVPSGFQYSLKVLRTAGNTSTAPLYAAQVIESVNMYDLAGKSVTVSFWAKAGANFSSASSALTVSVNTGTVADQGSSTAGSWTGLTSAIGSTATLTTTWTQYTFTGTFGSSVLEALVQFNYIPVGTAGADDSFFITGVQLEVGTVATPYERQIYSDQLAQCQRYYEKSYDDNRVPGEARTNGQFMWVNQNAQQNIGTAFFLVRKRATPTITLYSPSDGSSGNIYNGASSVSGTVASTGQGNFALYPTSAQSLTNLSVQYTASAEL
jgi:hypothetical protein